MMVIGKSTYAMHLPISNDLRELIARCILLLNARCVMCAAYPLLIGCLSLAVWRRGERGKKGMKNGQVGMRK